MICPLCNRKEIRCVSPYWYNRSIIECCCDCAEDFNLNAKGIVSYHKTPEGSNIPKWKAKILAK